MIVKKVVLLIFLLILKQNNAYYYMHSTDYHRYPSDYDCVSILDKSTFIREEEYCRREDKLEVLYSSSNEKNTVCFDGTLVSFLDLQLRRVSGFDLLQWYAPIDVIDQYELFLDQNTKKNGTHDWCNCTKGSFGRQCEYTFKHYQLTEEELHKSSELNRVHLVKNKQYSMKFVTRFNQFQVTNGTCYTGLPECNQNRIICLHWNQICDGQIDCSSGEDENNCLDLELNECDPFAEFRCLDGTCIPRSMMFDRFYDCLDASDEFHFANNDVSIVTFGLLEVESGHDYRCGSAWSSPCDDDARVCTKALWSKPSCESKRDQYFIQTLLGPLNGNTNDACWMYAMCQLRFRHFFKEIIQINNTQCHTAMTVCSNTTNEFLFPFINNYFVAHPSVKFVYQTKSSFSGMIMPDYICYDPRKCHSLFTPKIKKFNYFCNSWFEIMGNQSYQYGQWDNLIYAVRRTFFGCYLSSKNFTNIVSHTFDCDDGSPRISRYRIHDGYIDCINSKDEASELDSCALKLANRFQCRTRTSQCIPRVLLSNGIINCPDDASDEDLFFRCVIKDNYECQWKRGTLTNVIKFSFLRVCDGFIDAIEGNHTDESNCLIDWIHNCNSSWTRCDSYWQCRDGHDELNCFSDKSRWSNFLKCIKEEQFYCVNRTSKQLQCHPKELAGDGREDCVGGIDERVGGYCQTAYPMEKTRRFHCSNSSRCLNSKQLCDGVNDCGEGMTDDEKDLCSWLDDPSTTKPTSGRHFTCRDGTQISIQDRCNNLNDCSGHQNEDELFCELEEKVGPRPDAESINGYLSDIIVYPPSTSPSTMATRAATAHMIIHGYESKNDSNVILKFDDMEEKVHLFASVPEKKHIDFSASSRITSTSIPDRVYVAWYCNSGLLVRYFNRSDRCLCLSPFYGDRCQFQRRRVSISFQMDVSDHYSSQTKALKVIFYLKNAVSLKIVDHRELILVPYYRRYISPSVAIQQRYLVRLLSKEQFDNHYVHIESYLVTNSSLEFQAAWYYKLRFPFLPVVRLSLLLILVSRSESIGSCGNHGQLMPYINAHDQHWCLCNNGWFGEQCDQSCAPDFCSSHSICRGWPLSCLCPLNYMGSTCRVSTRHVCWDGRCLNNGTCLTLAPYAASPDFHFYCRCPPQYFGTRCKVEGGRLTFQFDKYLMEQHLHSTVAAMILRFTTLYVYSTDITGILEERYRHLYKNVNLKLSQTLFFDRVYHLIDFSFIQLFSNSSNPYGDYFLISANNTPSDLYSIYVPDRQPIHTLDTIVRLSNHIPYIDKLFNSTVLNLIAIERVKYYQQPCRENVDLVGFHDEAFMCMCNRHRLPQCFIFIHDIANCSSRNNICLNKALCLQDDEKRNPLGYVCICERCFFGDFCQFTTSEYSISLDALIGQRIGFDDPIYHQSASVQLYVGFVVLFFIVSCCLNSFTIVLFTLREKLRATDCGLYIMVSSAFGLCSLAVLLTKFIFLLIVPKLGTSRAGCASVEYLLKLCPTICDWINAFVSLERLSMASPKVQMNMGKKTQANQRHYRKFTFITIILILFIGTSMVHDPIHRQSVVDDRLSNGRRPWCIVKFDQQYMRIYNITINIIHHVGPFSINLISSIFILLLVSRNKSNVEHQPFLQALKKQFLSYKHWILTPLLLALLALPRLIFALIFTCISSSDAWQSHLLLISYFIGFFPQIGTFIIFVLPSEEYKGQVVQLFKRHSKKQNKK